MPTSTSIPTLPKGVSVTFRITANHTVIIPTIRVVVKADAINISGPDDFSGVDVADPRGGVEPEPAVVDIFNTVQPPEVHTVVPPVVCTDPWDDDIDRGS